MKINPNPIWSGVVLPTIISVLLFTCGIAQGDEDVSPALVQKELDASAVSSFQAKAGLPVKEVPTQLSAPQALTASQIGMLNQNLARTHLQGPLLRTQSPTFYPDPQTQSYEEADDSLLNSGIVPVPSAPETITIMRRTGFQATVPAGNRSNVMENSVGQLGRYVFQTGNWFAARSTDGGATFTYVNPFTGFTAPSSFCCDQLALTDESRNMLIWLRQGIAYTASNGNYQNEFKLSISTNGGASFLTYSFIPTGTNSTWTNTWWDYPEMQLAGKYLYIAYNQFNRSNVFVRSVILRFPLDSLRVGAGFSYNYFSDSNWFTFEPVAGADHVMYWASNWPTTAPQNSRLRIWKWDENSTSVSFVDKTVTAWDLTGRGQAICGSTTGNWTGRIDQRITAGARYGIHGSNLNIPGRKILGWWWTARQNAAAGFPLPRIEGAAFYEDNFAQVAGLQGRPFVWNSSNCFAYPAAAPNNRGDVALIMHYSSGTGTNPQHLPYVGAAIADELTTAPPGWQLFNLQTSLGRPADSAWGDYNTIRRFQPSGEIWAAASHYLPTSSGTCCSATSPLYAVFGRERDRWGYDYWFNK